MEVGSGVGGWHWNESGFVTENWFLDDAVVVIIMVAPYEKEAGTRESVRKSYLENESIVSLLGYYNCP